jgi:hypothetical protein
MTPKATRPIPSNAKKPSASPVNGSVPADGPEDDFCAPRTPDFGVLVDGDALPLLGDDVFA